MGLPAWPETPEELERFERGLEEIFVWGQQQSWIMLGGPVHISVTVDGLGYTAPAEGGRVAEIHVNPLVLLEPGGAQYLKGLILHELGHHEAHFSDTDWGQVHLRARSARLGSLLNIIADEHLERRLRSRRAQWGEALDALAAYAFKGDPVLLEIEGYASLMGMTPDAAREALTAGGSPGRILRWEHCLRLEGLGGVEVDGAEFIRRLFDALAERTAFELAGERRALLGKVRQVRGQPSGPLDLVLGHPTFRVDAQGFETGVRFNVSEALRREPGETVDAYLERTRRLLEPALEAFPGLKRYIDELEVSRESRWFWNKQASMLHNMRRRYTFRGTFLPAQTMSREEIDQSFPGWEAHVTPGELVRLLLDDWRPVSFEDRRRPLTVRLSWTEALAAPGSSSCTRFFIALRLGLGRKSVHPDETALAALRAVPRRLKDRSVAELLDIVETVAGILGDEALDEERSVAPPEEAGDGDEGRPDPHSGNGSGEPPETAGSSAEQGGGGTAGGSPTETAGSSPDLTGELNRSLARKRGELSRPLPMDRPEPVDASIAAARETARERVREWLDQDLPVEATPSASQDTPERKRAGRSRGVLAVTSRGPGSRAGSASALTDHDVLNIAETCEFDPILELTAVPADPRRYAAILHEVRPEIRALRRYLQTLGQQEEELTGQVRGRRFDPARARRLAVLGDPHVLIGREERPAPDLFLVVAVDCSGSMMMEERMERALAFAVLLLEAARGMKGIGVRVIGFTDSEVFDAGGPGDTFVASLVPDGGNNDAAGLLQAARIALASGRERRLLIMVSDGFPTECSVEALEHLVALLESEYGIPSAQVAVAPLDEGRGVFPDYTDLAGGELRDAVAAFGRMIQRLVRTRFGL
jgi:hypothetical protein